MGHTSADRTKSPGEGQKLQDKFVTLQRVSFLFLGVEVYGFSRIQDIGYLPPAVQDLWEASRVKMRYGAPRHRWGGAGKWTRDCEVTHHHKGKRSASNKALSSASKYRPILSIYVLKSPSKYERQLSSKYGVRAPVSDRLLLPTN